MNDSDLNFLKSSYSLTCGRSGHSHWLVCLLKQHLHFPCTSESSLDLQHLLSFSRTTIHKDHNHQLCIGLCCWFSFCDPWLIRSFFEDWQWSGPFLIGGLGLSYRVNEELQTVGKMTRVRIAAIMCILIRDSEFPIGRWAHTVSGDSRYLQDMICGIRQGWLQDSISRGSWESSLRFDLGAK